MTMQGDTDAELTLTVAQLERLPGSLRLELEIYIPWVGRDKTMRYTLPTALAAAIQRSIAPPQTEPATADDWTQLVMF